MDQSQCIALATQLKKALQCGHVEAFCSHFCEDAELIIPNASCLGRDAIRNAVIYLNQKTEHLQITLNRVTYTQNLAFIEWRWRDQNRETGMTQETETMIVLEFANDKIQRWREYQAPVTA